MSADISDTSPPSSRPTIAIIGAALTGLSLALALLQQQLYAPSDITIYDLRSPDTPDPANSSGVILTPNGLRVLDLLGVLPRIASRCWLSEYRTFKNEDDVTTRKTLITSESLYGYANHRLWRKVLLETLLEMVRERGVRIVWQARFEGVVSESDSQGVVFSVNGEEVVAGMLFGADGIHSKVRKYVAPDDGGPEYTGIAGVISHIPWSDVSWPYESYERACTIQGKPGALVLMPEDREGIVIMVAMQLKMETRSRAEWDALRDDKAFLLDLFAQRRDDWQSVTAKNIIDAVCRHPDTLYMWPFMRIARLERWFSETGRVVILGDAAHALPPSSGQGLNQSLEDVYALTKLLSLSRAEAIGADRLHLKQAQVLGFWQSLRQDRIDAIFDWATNVTNVRRMPQEERDRLIREGKLRDAENLDDMRWLYQPRTDEMLNKWIEELKKRDT